MFINSESSFPKSSNPLIVNSSCPPTFLTTLSTFGISLPPMTYSGFAPFCIGCMTNNLARSAAQTPLKSDIHVPRCPARSLGVIFAMRRSRAPRMTSDSQDHPTHASRSKPREQLPSLSRHAITLLSTVHDIQPWSFLRTRRGTH